MGPLASTGIPALRRVLALFMVASLMLGPLSAAMAAHHAEDVDATLVLMSAGDIAGHTLPDHASVPVGDHDCHGCAAAMLAAPVVAPSARMPAPADVLSDALVPGRGPASAFRPPRA